MVPRSVFAVAAMLGVLAVAAAVPPLGSPGPAVRPVTLSAVAVELDVVALMCPPGYDNGVVDDVCLAFGGTIPGPTLVFREGDAVTVTVHNRVDETVTDLPVSQTVKNKFLGKPFSFHRHGTATAAEMDGVHAHGGTNIVSSEVAAGSSFAYEFTTPFVGAWHYHDHSFGPGHFGTEGAERGLFGDLLVLPAGDAAPTVFDLHLLDEGPNGGLGMGGAVAVGGRFMILVAGLGNQWWDVTVTAPRGAVVGMAAVAPGVSHGFLVESAIAGTYAWTATSPFHPETFDGEVVAA